MRAEQESGAESCFFIFLPALVMGNFMVLNLFLALLLNSFNSEELKNRKEVMVNVVFGVVYALLSLFVMQRIVWFVLMLY